MDYFVRESKNILQSLFNKYNIPASKKSLSSQKLKSYLSHKKYDGGFSNLFPILLDYPVETSLDDSNGYRATPLKNFIKNYNPQEYTKQQLRHYYFNVIYAENLKNRYGINISPSCEEEVKKLDNCLYKIKDKINFVPISKNKEIINTHCKKEITRLSAKKCISTSKQI